MSDSADKEMPNQILEQAVSEALEDRGLSNAIEEGLKSETVSRDEIFAMLERRKVQHEISEYAKAVAGTSDDLDEDLEAAALELWDDLP